MPGLYAPEELEQVRAAPGVLSPLGERREANWERTAHYPWSVPQIMLCLVDASRARREYCSQVAGLSVQIFRSQVLNPLKERWKAEATRPCTLFEFFVARVEHAESTVAR